MAADTITSTVSNTFGLSKWNLGLSSTGTLVFWIILCIIIAGIIGGAIYAYYYYKRIYKNQISCFSFIGNIPRKLFTDRAKEVRFGHVGDSLFYLRKQKRYIPVPTIQVGAKEFWYWKREDGELINIGLENLDVKMKAMNCFFVDADMRMQRLGIEKNLQFRFQEQNFWQKYGGLLIGVGMFVIMAVLLIVLFMQWSKAANDLSIVSDKLGTLIEKAGAMCGQRPSTTASSGTGIIPALVLFVVKKKTIYKRFCKRCNKYFRPETRFNRYCKKCKVIITKERGEKEKITKEKIKWDS